VLRGGSYVNDGWACRAANRYRCTPEERISDNGFRVACVLTRPAP
jgi:hypothetical protein